MSTPAAPTPAAVHVALLTPFDERGAVDPAALAAHVELLLEQGVDGIMPCGTTGEGPLLEPDEILEIVSQVVASAGGRARVIAHVGRAATSASAALAERAAEAGAESVAAVVPWYYPLGDDEILAHYRRLLAASPLPVYAYTIPRHTGNDLSAGVVAALAGEGLAGLKDSSASFERHLEYLLAARAAPARFELFTGSAGMVLDALRAGAAGSVTAIANVRADLLVGLRECLHSGDEARAEALQRELGQARAALAARPAMRSLKAEVARQLAGRGRRYPTGLRAPLT